MPEEPPAQLAYRLRNFRGRVTRCSRCRHMISGGWTHPNDLANPPANALCKECYGFILHEIGGVPR